MKILKKIMIIILKIKNLIDMMLNLIFKKKYCNNKKKKLNFIKNNKRNKE